MDSSQEGRWEFLGATWAQSAGGELAPPEGTDVEYLAVRAGATYADFTATFRYQLRTITGIRFVFRLQDSRRYYALDMPANGQQFRSRTFWAGLVVADGSPLQRYLTFTLVPGLCPQVGHWYSVRVEAKGPRLRAWIDGIPVVDVEDRTYDSGRVGIASIQNPYPESPRFSDFRIEGTARNLPGLPPLRRPEPHWITPCPEADPETYQGYANLLRSTSGEVTLHLTFGNPNYGETRRTVYLRSKDAGRTWGEPGPATLQSGFGAPFVRNDGTWVCVFPNLTIPKAPLYAYESRDEGKTWKGALPLVTGGGWPARWATITTWRPARMLDGTLVLPIICQPAGEPDAAEHVATCTVMVIRSEDDGRTWSDPILCDADNHRPGEALTEYKFAGRSYEVAMAEGDEGTLVGIGRPDRDPYMWRMVSNDGGRRWEPAAIGQFPGYCPSLTRTASGALVATVRYPHFAAYLSRDGGRTWGTPVIVDYCLWANQQAVEVEPDVVLVTYMGKIMDPGEADSRIARLKVTPAGLVLDN